MEKLILSQKDVMLIFICLSFLFVIFSGFGYFGGRYHQIQLQKSTLQPIPDINCHDFDKNSKK